MSLEKLIQLSHELGREERRLAILGEGNTSMRGDAAKARGGLERFDREGRLFRGGSFAGFEVFSDAEAVEPSGNPP